MSERRISKRQDKVENEKDACVPGFCKDDFGQLSLDDLPFRLVNLCPKISTVLADSFPQFDSGKLSDLMERGKREKTDQEDEAAFDLRDDAIGDVGRWDLRLAQETGRRSGREQGYIVGFCSNPCSAGPSPGKERRK